MKILGDAGKDKTNGSRRVFYECECGFIGSTRASRAKNQKWCATCSRIKAKRLSNSFKIIGNIALIDISTDKFPNTFCKIDAKNIGLVIDGKGKWFAADFCKSVIYAVRNARGEKMHRLILGADDSEIVDHDDGDGLNNLESNLKLCDQLLNMKNRTLDRRNISGFIGVVPSPTKGHWVAQGSADGKRHYLGTFKTLDGAVAARAKFSEAHDFNKNHGRARP